MSAEFPIPLLMAVDGLLMTPMRTIIAASGNAVGVAPYADNFRAVTYQGTSATQTISLGFETGFGIFKQRDAAEQFVLVDAVRGPAKNIFITSTQEVSSNAVVSFDAAGVTLGRVNSTNKSAGEYVAWCWKADRSASHATNTGEHYNVSSGVSVITYTGTGGNRLVSHSLEVAPKMLCVKELNGSSHWRSYHEDIAATDPGDYALVFSKADNLNNFNTYWNDTVPTSTTFALGSSTETNQSGLKYTAFLLSEVSGFSAMGFYIGNGNAVGPVISTTFKPGWLLIKGVNTVPTQNWVQLDTARNPSNPRKTYFHTDQDQAESEALSQVADMNDTSFQIVTTHGGLNENTKRYIYAAFKDTWSA